MFLDGGVFRCTGYFSTTSRLKDKPTELQATLGRIPPGAMDSLVILEKLTYNTAVQPKEAKFRRIKLQNPKIKAAVVNVEDALAALLLMGWERETNEADGEVLLLPDRKTLTMQQVRDIQTAQQDLVRKERDLKRSASTASIRSTSSEQEPMGLAVETGLEPAKP